MQNYQDWKNWDSSNFACASKEENLYFSKLKSKFKLTASLNVLEIGFGNGSFLDYSKSVGWNISGVEVIPTLVNRAINNGFKAFKSINDVPTKFKYDLIVAFDVIEHIAPENLCNFLKKVTNLLQPNGVFIIRVPNGSSPFGLSNQHGDTTHQNIITESKMDFWANSVNLKINFKGGDIYLIYNGKKIKFLSRVLKRILQLSIERLVRWIFSPQSKGFLSANSIYVLSKKNNES
jgi:2-polyprenyl-3-methyl-5-hydroxy-6-metoxy-1,4-benzoquinol methylase